MQEQHKDSYLEWDFNIPKKNKLYTMCPFKRSRYIHFTVNPPGAVKFQWKTCSQFRIKIL